MQALSFSSGDITHNNKSPSPATLGDIQWRLRLWLACWLIGANIIASNLQAQEPALLTVPDSQLALAFTKLNRNSRWELIREQSLAFPTYHPQGLVRTGNRFYLSTVQIVERSQPLSKGSEFDRTVGNGVGHLIVFDDEGKQLNRITLGHGDCYHPGGIDQDEQALWVPVAEYRPHSRSIIYRVTLPNLEIHELFRFPDHIGALVRDRINNRLIGFSWGSRKIYSWQLDAKMQLTTDAESSLQSAKLNPQHFIDYQDCQFIAHNRALCSGLASLKNPLGGNYSLGGINLVQLDSGQALHQLPIDRFAPPPSLRVMTQNPFYAEPTEDGVKFYFIPEDNDSRLFIYAVR